VERRKAVGRVADAGTRAAAAVIIADIADMYLTSAARVSMCVDRFFGESRGVSEWTHARVPKDASRGVGLSNVKVPSAAAFWKIVETRVN
jgi:hypothetical protein